MSWDQGVQVREDLPPRFVEMVERAAAERGIHGALEYITWFETDRDVVYLDFGEAGTLKARLRNA